VIAIGTPTTSSTHSASSSPLALAGTTSDNIGVTYVSWTNSAGGSGTATLTSGWTASVPLSSGTNILTFTAHDAAGNTSSDGITVTYTAATPGGGGSPGGGGGGGGGGCGLLGLELLLLGIFRRRR
jgi:hypothetical protein